MRYALASMLVLTLFTGCGKDDPAPDSGNNPPSASAAGDPRFVTPEGTLKAFLAACTAKDWKTATECCSANAQGKIAAIRDMKLSDEDQGEVSRNLGAMTVGATTIEADGKSASVEFTRRLNGEERNGKMKLEKIGADWKMLDAK